MIPLILSFIIIIFPLIPLLILRGNTGFTNLFPGDFGTQMALFFWSTVISAIIGVLLGYFLAPIYLFIHRNTIGRNRTYYIEKRPAFEQFRHRKFYGIFKSLFPALLVLNQMRYVKYCDQVQPLFKICFTEFVLTNMLYRKRQIKQNN